MQINLGGFIIVQYQLNCVTVVGEITEEPLYSGQVSASDFVHYLEVSFIGNLSHISLPTITRPVQRPALQ